MVNVQNFRPQHAVDVWLWKLHPMWSMCLQLHVPGSPLLLFVTNVESDGEGVPASHPWDSDEEDELDTHSRNRAGVPILGRALVESRWIEDRPFSVPPHSASKF